MHGWRAVRSQLWSPAIHLLSWSWCTDLAVKLLLDQCLVPCRVGHFKFGPIVFLTCCESHTHASPNLIEGSESQAVIKTPNMSLLKGRTYKHQMKGMWFFQHEILQGSGRCKYSQRYNHGLINLNVRHKVFYVAEHGDKKDHLLENTDVHNLAIFSGGSQPEFGVYIYPFEY